MIKELHLAAQYLAAAGICFLDKKNDDSHTNLGWSNEANTLSSRPLNKNGDFLSLNFNAFSLEWNSQNKSTESFSLASKTHQEILDWIRNKVNASNFSKEYQYAFHYDLGYDLDLSNYTFPEANHEQLNHASTLFGTAQLAISKALEQNELKSEIRIWPHHFDMGAYAKVNSQLDLGMGLAIPDSSINDFYYYISGYHGDKSVETKGFKKLSLGEWQTGDWKAATLNATGIGKEQALRFFCDAISIYSNNT